MQELTSGRSWLLALPLQISISFLFFSALKEAEDEEFKSIIMRLYEGCRTGNGEGLNMSIIQLLARADSEYKRLTALGQWKTKAKSTELLGLQANLTFSKLSSQPFLPIRMNHLQLSLRQINQLVNHARKKTKLNDTTWFYCGNCYSRCHWNKTH